MHMHVMLPLRCLILSLAAVRCGALARAKAGGFGASAPAKPKRLSAEKLLEKSESRYDALEAKYEGNPEDDAEEDLFLRDFVVAVRAPRSPQFSDWVPVAVLGVVSSAEAGAVLPHAVALHRREILESARHVAGGRAKHLGLDELELSTEPYHDWQKRVLEAAGDEDFERAAEVLALDGGLEGLDAAALRTLYRERCKACHPDAGGAADGSLPTVADCKNAYDALSSRLERQRSDALYESIGGRAATFKTVSDLPEKPGVPGLEAAATRVDPDLATPFLLRNVQRDARAKKALEVRGGFVAAAERDVASPPAAAAEAGEGRFVEISPLKGAMLCKSWASAADEVDQKVGNTQESDLGRSAVGVLRFGEDLGRRSRIAKDMPRYVAAALALAKADSDEGRAAGARRTTCYAALGGLSVLSMVKREADGSNELVFLFSNPNERDLDVVARAEGATLDALLESAPLRLRSSVEETLALAALGRLKRDADGRVLGCDPI